MHKTNKKPLEITKKPRQTGTTIREMDQKLLWARAAGICSMPECRKKLTVDTAKNKSTTVGVMCHIVGEKKSAARGNSELSISDRNLYSNLILLCAHHHNIIDSDEKKYTIEYLHKIKVEHELWLDETVSAKKLSPSDLVYSSLIDSLSASFQLDNWIWFIEHAIRNLVYHEFADAQTLIIERQLAIVWPGENAQIEIAIKNLMQGYIDYIEQFFSYPTIFRDGMYRIDRSYERVYKNDYYDYYLNKRLLWEKKNFSMLCMFVIRLNEFVDAVRKYYNPIFYIKRGKFIIFDSCEGAALNPSLRETQKKIKEIEKEIRKFETTFKGKRPILEI